MTHEQGEDAIVSLGPLLLAVAFVLVLSAVFSPRLPRNELVDTRIPFGCRDVACSTAMPTPDAYEGRRGMP
mgnify:CR=1 FL=1